MLTAWPEIEVVGLTANDAEVVHQVEECQPNVVLMDIRMPVTALSGADRLGGLEAIRFVKSRWPQVGIVVLTMYTTLWTVALAAGADAFLLKGCPAEALRDALLKAG